MPRKAVKQKKSPSTIKELASCQNYRQWRKSKHWRALEKYLADIRYNRIRHSPYIRWGVERFIRDLRNKKFIFDWEAVQHYIDFVELFCRHAEGKWRGELITLAPFQILFAANVFGWKMAKNGYVRYKNIILEIAKKNAKSALISTICLYVVLFSNEGAKVYAVARDREQAEQVFKVSVQMLQNCEEKQIQKVLRAVNKAIVNEKKFNEFKALSSENKSFHGKNTFLGIFDEAAIIDDPDQIKNITSGMVARASTAFSIYITTAAPQQTGYYWELRQYALEVLNPDSKTKDETLYAQIYAPMPMDTNKDDEEQSFDPYDPNNWIVANPLYPISPQKESLEVQMNKAKRMPSERVEYLTRHMNIYMNSMDSFVGLEYWDNPKTLITDKPDLSKLPMTLGLDLSQSQDLTSCVNLWWSAEEQLLYILAMNWCCQEAYDILPDTLRPIYDDAIRKGHLAIAGKKIIDYDIVKKYIGEQKKESENFQGLYFDKWNSNKLIQEIEDEMNFEPLGVDQTIKQLFATTQDFENLYTNLQVMHHKDDFFRWQLGNCSLKLNPDGAYKIDYGPDRKMKIDAPSAMINGLTAVEFANKPSGFVGITKI